MKNSLLKIGEMAELNHVSTQTLRLYAKNKLLEPEYLDPKTGYRYYTLEQCAKLDLIRALKSCRLSLEQIAEILSLSSEELLLQALEEQTGALADEIYNLSVSRNNLSRVQKNLQILNTLPPFGQVFFEYVPERKIDVQKTDFDFFELEHEGYERMLRHMQNYLHENQLPPSYFINVGTLMEKEYFIKGTYSSHSAFIFVDELYPEKGSVRTLPQNTYMSVASDNIALESKYAKHLYEEIQRNEMIPCGDYLCEVLTQFPVHQAKQLIYKIQVPVQRINGRKSMIRGFY
ncbi:MAG: MerR family transcriptional regulator [Candidatus Fimisoma sp.]|nr:MerR family transcriptional regulator [Candidatus Fimisoma sp.]